MPHGSVPPARFPDVFKHCKIAAFPIFRQPGEIKKVMVYPWQKEAWRSITSCGENLPNAWLLYGARGTGKVDFARTLAHGLLCENTKDYTACGSCPSCLLAAADNHPDLYILTPIIEEGDSAKKLAQIKIDAVREMIADVRLTPLRAPRRVVLVYPAESLNLQAANALLKILEEPSPTVVFILVTHTRDRLLPTVKSRCRQFALPAPDFAAAGSWLQENAPEKTREQLAFHGGAPLFAEDESAHALRGSLVEVLCAPRLLAVLDYAAAFDRAKQPLAVFLDALDKWLADILAHSCGAQARFYPAHREVLAQLAQKTDTRKIFRLRDTLAAVLPFGRHTLNTRLAAESLLIDYMKLVTRKG